MPVIECDDPVGIEAHREDGHGGIHGAEWQVRVLANEIAYVNPVVRIRGDHWKICKPFQKAGFHFCTVAFAEEIGYFGHAQRRDDDVGAAS